LRASLEVADIFRAEGAGYRAVQAGHLSLTQLIAPWLGRLSPSPRQHDRR
jgi:hypothetical protein